MRLLLDADTALHPVGQRGARSTPATVWSRRHFVQMLAETQLESQNSDSFLGNLWHLLNPLSLALVYYIVFGILFGARDDNPGYIAFLVIGLLTFTWTRKCVSAGARSIVRNSNLLRSIGFPRATLPVSAVAAEGYAHLSAVGAMLLVVVLTGERVTLSWLLLPVVLALQGAMGLGLALLAARLTHHVRDVEQALPYALRLWMYVSGVFFEADRIPEGIMRDLFSLNPAFVVIDVTRDVLTGAVSWLQLGLLAGWAVVLLALGWAFFTAREHEYGRV